MRKSFELFACIVLARVCCTSSVEQHRTEESISHTEQNICRSLCSIYAIAFPPRRNILQGDESIRLSTESEQSPAEPVSIFSRNVNPMISVTYSNFSTLDSLTNEDQNESLNKQETAYPIQAFTDFCHQFHSQI